MKNGAPPTLPMTAARVLQSTSGPLVLAVSGGLDSMTLLQLAARDRDVRARCVVATFDHGTGPHATAAVRLVRAAARSLKIPVVTGRATQPGSSEAEWRDMRWRFLRSVAARRGARIVTGHTRDDQVETVVMRILRGAGARGLAALYARDGIVRPLLGVSRRTLEQYAAATRLRFIEDPTNTDRRFLRNRVRHDLLPALRAQRPRLDRDLLVLARRAARLRAQTERIVSRLTGTAALEQSDRLVVRTADLVGINREGLALLWPPLVARLGVALDRRGVVRATDFALTARSGQRAQCASGVMLERTRTEIVARLVSAQATVTPVGGAEFSQWRVREVKRPVWEAHVARTGVAWGAVLNRGTPYEVRPWQPGDRVRASGATRRVKRYFSERAIPVSERPSWPVVVTNGRVFWVPGVYQPSAAVTESGRYHRYLVCERRGR